MSAPGKAGSVLSVKVRHSLRFSTGLSPKGAFVAVTKQMKPPAEKSQTATKVNVVNSGICKVEEADGFYVPEGSISCAVKSRYGLLFLCLRPWYGRERKLPEPGSPVQFLRKQIPGNNLKWRGFGD